jgi:hypothetical protein
MIKEITNDFLTDTGACDDGIAWWRKEQNHETFTILNRLIETNNLNWANWLIVRVMERKQKNKYAVFAAQQVLDIYEKKYPDDLRPRKAIDAALKCIGNDTEENRNAAYDASGGSVGGFGDYAAASAAYAAFAAAESAGGAAAESADYAASGAADYAASYAAFAAAESASYAAADAAAAAAKKEMQIKILNYGIGLL